MSLGQIVIDEHSIKDMNTVKDVVIRELERDGIITSEQSTECSAAYNVIALKPKWFSALSNFFKKNNDEEDAQFICIYKDSKTPSVKKKKNDKIKV